MGRRPRRASTVPGRVSPQPSFNLCRYDEDIWTEIAKRLDGKSLVMLAIANKWFQRVVMQDNIWKHVCLRDLGAKDPDGSHSYKFQQQDKQTDWMRIGSFGFDSPLALLTGTLFAPQKIPQEENVEDMLKSSGSIVLKNVKTGVWIADLQLVRCPVCDFDTCEVSMLTLDARHMELFLSEGFLNRNWEYKLIGTRDVSKIGASGAILDIKHLNDWAISEKFDHNIWMGKAEDWEPRTAITDHAVAVNCHLEENDEVSRVQVKYHVMKAGNDGEVVSIRVSLQCV